MMMFLYRAMDTASSGPLLLAGKTARGEHQPTSMVRRFLCFRLSSCHLEERRMITPQLTTYPLEISSEFSPEKCSFSTVLVNWVKSARILRVLLKSGGKAEQ